MYASLPAEQSLAEPKATTFRWGLPGGWACLGACLALVPFVWGLSTTRIFYIRDLSLFFWGRYLWVRRSIMGGEWPLWDPYIAAGQSATADALHQLYLLPSLALRLIPNEVLGFNLWVAMPFPLAAFGAWALFARRFSAPAATLGAIAYALSGPITATGTFPNMSWSVAAMPWVLWSIDRANQAQTVTPRHVAVIALIVALQALSGEPVTLFATLVLGAAFAFFIGSPSAHTLRDRVLRTCWIGMGCGLGVVIAAIQLAPMMEAAGLSERSVAIIQDFWSLHPLALLEFFSLHLFGDYYTSQSLLNVPWVPLLNSGREPFFFSLYLGLPLVALALIGFSSSGGPRSWTPFWLTAGMIGLIGAFGGYTPIYPFLQEHLPVLGSFRFPVKYIVVTVLAVAAGAAAGWDALQRSLSAPPESSSRLRVRVALAFVLGVGALACIGAAACLYLPTPTAFRFYSLAEALEAKDPVAAAAFMLRNLPRAASTVLLLALATSGLVVAVTRRGAEAVWAGRAFYVFIAGDLLVRAWGLNPAFEASRLAQPEWLAAMPADAHGRFYVGGKRDGTLDVGDADGSPAFRNPPGLVGSASRAALSAQAAFYPSAWRRREMLSYDLAVLWPKQAGFATGRFLDAQPEERRRFLDRTGVRYRVLPSNLVEGLTPLSQIPYFIECYLYDFGDTVAPRATVVPDTRIVPEWDLQVEALLLPGWDRTVTAILDRAVEPAGTPGPAVEPFAKVISESLNRVVVNAGAGANGGHLVLLESYSSDWQVSVDGQPADLARANGLFRGVHLTPGNHEVEFLYRPRAFRTGALATGLGFFIALGMFLWPLKTSRPQDRKTVRPQDRKTARPLVLKPPSPRLYLRACIYSRVRCRFCLRCRFSSSYPRRPLHSKTTRVGTSRSIRCSAGSRSMELTSTCLISISRTRLAVAMVALAEGRAAGLRRILRSTARCSSGLASRKAASVSMDTVSGRRSALTGPSGRYSTSISTSYTAH